MNLIPFGMKKAIYLFIIKFFTYVCISILIH